jgi:hypothetical protein
LDLERDNDMTLKGLTVDVLRRVRRMKDGSLHIEDSSNKGISSRVDEFVLVDPAIAEVFEARADRPALKIVRRMIAGKLYVHAEPMTPCPANLMGYTFGGNFVTSCDSRISEICQYPIPVHDRMETWEAYRMLSV